MFWTIVGFAFIVWLTVVILFTPRIDYHVTLPLKPDSDEFLHVVQSMCQVAVHLGNSAQVFTNGTHFYPAMRDAILAAEASVNLEAYIFHQGEVADVLIDAMVERANAGVEVRLVLDSIGSSGVGRRNVQRLRGRGRLVGEAGERPPRVARHDSAVRRTDRGRAAGRVRGKLAGMLRRDHHRSASVAADRGGRADARHARQELPRRPRDRFAGRVP